MSGRSWWVGLRCRWCRRPVKVTAADGVYRRGLDGSGPWAEHFACQPEGKP